MSEEETGAPEGRASGAQVVIITSVDMTTWAHSPAEVTLRVTTEEGASLLIASHDAAEQLIRTLRQAVDRAKEALTAHGSPPGVLPPDVPMRPHKIEVNAEAEGDGMWLTALDPSGRSQSWRMSAQDAGALGTLLRGASQEARAPRDLKKEH